MDWKAAVTNVRSGSRLMTLKSGRHVSLRTNFAIQEGGWIYDHGEITVTKIAAGSFRTSYVQVGGNQVVLDSEDFTPFNKGELQRDRHMQTPRGWLDKTLKGMGIE